MSHLLHLDSSARHDAHSRALGRVYVEAWRSAHPQGHYTYRDLAAAPVPPIDQAWTEICAYAQEHGITDPYRLVEGVRTPEQRKAWALVEPLLGELIAADVVLIGAPMYNYSVPAALKAWIDQVTFPRAALTCRVVVVAARGGSYAPGSPRERFDHHESYLRDFFAGHFGVTDVSFIAAEYANALVDPLLAEAEDDFARSYADARCEADALGRA